MLLETILWVIVGFNLGFIFRGYLVKRILEKAANDLLEKSKNRLVEVEVEHEQGLFFIYSKKNREFLGQGKTIEEALQVIQERFPGKVFNGHISEDKAKEWGIKVPVDQ
jgi:hypothetical protein